VDEGLEGDLETLWINELSLKTCCLSSVAMSSIALLGGILCSSSTSHHKVLAYQNYGLQLLQDHVVQSFDLSITLWV
jgi:hypothetical protein